MIAKSASTGSIARGTRRDWPGGARPSGRRPQSSLSLPRKYVLATARQESAQQSPAFELLQPGLPAYHARAQPSENSRQLGRNHALPRAEQAPCVIDQKQTPAQRQTFHHSLGRRIQLPPIFDRAEPDGFLQPGRCGRSGYWFGPAPGLCFWGFSEPRKGGRDRKARGVNPGNVIAIRLDRPVANARPS